MKKTLKLFIINFCLILITFQINAVDYEWLHYPYKLINDVTDRYYYLSVALNTDPSEYEDHIIMAEYNWGTVSSLVSFSETTSYISSSMDIYADSTGIHPYLNGWTIIRIYGEDPIEYPINITADWLAGEIYINELLLDPINDENQCRATIAHEMGHVFGLNENVSNSTTIMYPSSAGRSTYIPTQRDANGIYAIYGGY